MKHVLTASYLTLALGFSAVMPAMAQEQLPINPARMALARIAVAMDSPRDALLEGNTALAKQPMFNQVFANLDFKRINEQAATIMAQEFTSEEIRALIAFKQSEVGKNIDLKMPGYQKLVGAMVQNEMKATFEGLMLTQGRAGVGLPTPVPTQAPAMGTGSSGMGGGVGGGLGTPLKR